MVGAAGLGVLVSVAVLAAAASRVVVIRKWNWEKWRRKYEFGKQVIEKNDLEEGLLSGTICTHNLK